jgi:hypothetical protein
MHRRMMECGRVTHPHAIDYLQTSINLPPQPDLPRVSKILSDVSIYRSVTNLQHEGVYKTNEEGLRLISIYS